MERVKMFAINGIALAGKDSFVKLVDHFCDGGEVRCISTIDPVKEIYTNFFGWKGDKTPEHRLMLNYLKQIWIQTSNGPYNWACQQVTDAIEEKVQYLFIMVREFEEMMSIVDIGRLLSVETYTLEVTRDGLEIPPIEQSFLDQHPKDYKYDISVHNPTVDSFPYMPQLEIAAHRFCRSY